MRVARMLINVRVLLERAHDSLYKLGNWPVPQDAKLVSISYNQATCCIIAIFEHESFTDIPEGSIIPEISPPWIEEM